MRNLYTIIAILIISIIGTLIFRKKWIRFIPIEIIIIAIGYFIGPDGLNFLNKYENIQIEPIIILLIGATAFLAGFKFKINDRRIIKPVFKLTTFFFLVSFLISFLSFFGINSFLNLLNFRQIILIAIFSSSVFPVHFIFHKKKTYSSIINNYLSHFSLIFIFLILLFIFPLMINDTLIFTQYINYILFTFADIIIFSMFMLYFIKKSRDNKEFFIIFIGIVIFNTALCYIFNINPVSIMFFIGFILSNTTGKEYRRVEKYILNIEHPLFIGLLLITASFLILNNLAVYYIAATYFFTHIAAVVIPLVIVHKKFDKGHINSTPQTGAIYTIILCLMLLRSNNINTVLSPIIIANMLIYIIYYIMERSKI